MTHHRYTARRITGPARVVTVEACGITPAEIYADAMARAMFELTAARDDLVLRYEVTVCEAAKKEAVTA